MVARRHLDAVGAARLRGQRVDRERVLREHGLVPRLEERERDELQDVVAAVAEHDLAGGTPRRAASAAFSAKPLPSG